MTTNYIFSYYFSILELFSAIANGHTHHTLNGLRWLCEQSTLQTVTTFDYFFAFLCLWKAESQSLTGGRMRWEFLLEVCSEPDLLVLCVREIWHVQKALHSHCELFNCSIRNGTLCLMNAHNHGTSYQVTVIPLWRMLLMAAFFHLTCTLNLEVYDVAKRDSSTVFKRSQLGQKQRH